MSTPTSAAILSAAADPHLIERAVAVADSMGIPSPEHALRSNTRLLALAPVTATGDTVASVYEYAVAQMPPPPGKDPAAVTDEHLRHAITHLQQKGVLQAPVEEP